MGMTETQAYLSGNKVIGGKFFTDVVPLVADTYYQGMPLKYLASGTVVAAGGNTGNGTVTNVLADKTVKSGAYVLECTEAIVADTITAGTATPGGGNTGNGTVTGLAVSSTGAPAKQGTYILMCTESKGTPTSALGMVAGGGNTGNGTPGAVTFGTATKAGVYTITCIIATVPGSEIFQVLDPDGVRLDNLTVAAAYSNAHFAVTLADGGVDFIVGDTFTITVVLAHGGKFKLTDPAGVELSVDIQLPGTTGGTVVFTGAGLTFTITDGAVDFVTGDFFTITMLGSNGGIFKLTAPTGEILDDNIRLPGTALGSLSYVGHGFTFTLTDGATDFVAGDYFTITVSATGSYYYTTDYTKLSGIYNGENGRVISGSGYGTIITAGEIAEYGIVDDTGTHITITEAIIAEFADNGFYIKRM